MGTWDDMGDTGAVLDTQRCDGPRLEFLFFRRPEHFLTPPEDFHSSSESPHARDLGLRLDLLALLVAGLLACTS